jgi:DNA-binding winged helix-turn-helix (wHTH) protein
MTCATPNVVEFEASQRQADLQVEQKSHIDTAVSASSTIRFGAFELDVRAAELRKEGHRIRLQQQPFQILIELLERPGEVVLREEIRRKLWPDNTVVEFDHSINAAVKRLRDSLQDSADTPRYIETLPRLGYRFVAPVLRDDANQAAQPELAPVSVGPPPPPAQSHRRWWFAGAIAIALVATAIGLNLLQKVSKHANGSAAFRQFRSPATWDMKCPPLFHRKALASLTPGKHRVRRARAFT